MILLDADVLVLDLRYPTDAKFSINRAALERIRADGLFAGVTSQALLEVLGILSFNVSSQRLSGLAQQICLQYRLTVVPPLQTHPSYAGCMVDDVIAQMARKMASGDAVQAVQIRLFAPGADCLLTWNAKHFVGKLVIPALTPQEWLSLRPPTKP